MGFVSPNMDAFRSSPLFNMIKLIPAKPQHQNIMHTKVKEESNVADCIVTQIVPPSEMLKETPFIQPSSKAITNICHNVDDQAIITCNPIIDTDESLSKNNILPLHLNESTSFDIAETAPKMPTLDFSILKNIFGPDGSLNSKGANGAKNPSTVINEPQNAEQVKPLVDVVDAGGVNVNAKDKSTAINETKNANSHLQNIIDQVIEIV